MAKNIPRLHLIAPAAPPERLAACIEAACAAGDVASVLLTVPLDNGLVGRIQRFDIAVLFPGEIETTLAVRADGIEVDDIAAYREARQMLGADRIVGAFCAASRDRAMELGEAGADYVAFSQGGREGLVSWWTELFEIPCIAADPVSAEELDILLPYRPDFIRPDDAMWNSPDMARDVVARLTARLNA